jgi:hypothetical protein
MILTLFNPATDDLEKAYLTGPYSAGITSIEVTNNNRFATNDRILIGEMGHEKSEIVTVSSVNANGTTVVIGATVFDHEADTPVYKLRFDQVKFYRSTTTNTDAAFSLLATVDMDVDNANLTTIYDDTTGTDAYFYKMTVYHSISTLESAYTDVIGGSGWRRNQVGNIIDEILREVGDTQELNVNRTELLGYFNDVNDDLLVNVSKPYDFLHTRTALTRTANTNYIDFPTDSNGDQTMWKFDRMDYNYTDTTTDPDTDYTTTIPVIGPEEFRNTYTDNTVSTTTVTDATPEAMTLDTSVNRFRFSHPFETTASNVFYLHYWKYFTTINSEGDEIETPTPKIYKLYCKAAYYRKRGVTESSYNQVADRFEGQYMLEKSKYKGIDRKDKGTPRGFRPPSSLVRGYRK